MVRTLADVLTRLRGIIIEGLPAVLCEDGHAYVSVARLRELERELVAMSGESSPAPQMPESPR